MCIMQLDNNIQWKTKFTSSPHCQSRFPSRLIILDVSIPIVNRGKPAINMYLFSSICPSILPWPRRSQHTNIRFHAFFLSGYSHYPNPNFSTNKKCLNWINFYSLITYAVCKKRKYCNRMSEKKNSLLLTNVLYGLEDKTSTKKFPSVCLSVCTCVRGLFMWTQ